MKRTANEGGVIWILQSFFNIIIIITNIIIFLFFVLFCFVSFFLFFVLFCFVFFFFGGGGAAGKLYFKI